MLNGIYKKFKKGKIPYSFLPSLFKNNFLIEKRVKYRGQRADRSLSESPRIHITGRD
jgi:hypothetical protein